MLAEPVCRGDELRARDPKRKSLILQLSTKKGMRQVDIAREVRASISYVQSVLSKASKESRSVLQASKESPVLQQRWFEKSAVTKLAAVRAIILARKMPENTTDLINPSKFRDLTKKEEDANTFPYSLYSADRKERKKGTEWIRNHLSGKMRHSLGLVLMSAYGPEQSDLDDFVEANFLKLFEIPRYSKELLPIFQNLQAKDEFKQKGDGKRLQAKLSDLYALVTKRVEEAEKRFEQIKKRKHPPNLEIRKTIRKASKVAWQATKRKRSTKNIKSVHSLEEALIALEEIRAEKNTLDKAIDYFCAGYNRIQSVRAFISPFNVCCLARNCAQIAGVASYVRYAQEDRLVGLDRYYSNAPGCSESVDSPRWIRGWKYMPHRPPRRPVSLRAQGRISGNPDFGYAPAGS